MPQDYTIVCTEHPDEAELNAIGRGISGHNYGYAGPEGYRRLCVLLFAPGGKVVGGLVGSTYWGWLHVNWLWLEESLRGQGYGSRILATAEEQARARGVTNAYLDTFGFQAPEFYRKQGYEVFGTLEDFPAGYTRYFLRKRL